MQKLHVSSRLKRLQQSLDEMNISLHQQNELISKSEAMITRNNALIERKQTQIDQMNKKIDQKISSKDGVSHDQLTWYSTSIAVCSLDTSVTSCVHCTSIDHKRVQMQKFFNF